MSRPSISIKRLGEPEFVPTTQLKFPGLFQMWAYTVGHKRLLLRRTKGHGFATQVDILFKPVLSVHLPATLEGIEIRRVQLQELAAPPQLGTRSLSDEYGINRVRGVNVDGHVVASVVAAEESERDYYEPNLLMGPN